jgi:hypothetical protein
MKMSLTVPRRSFALTAVFGLLFALLMPMAQAQSAPRAPTAPVSAEMKLSAAQKSAFSDYKKFDPKEKPISWNEANARVEALDGHMGHVRGAPKPKAETKK